MIKFIYSEFSRNVSVFPWRSISFILSFACTYFILIFSSFGVKNLFYFFDQVTESYEMFVILKPNVNQSDIDQLKSDILSVSKSDGKTQELKLSLLTSEKVYEYILSEDRSKGIEFSEEDIKTYVPTAIKVGFSEMSSFKKIVLSSKIKKLVQFNLIVSDTAVPYPSLHSVAELYLENRRGLFLLMLMLYFSVFILLYLLLTLSLKEHRNKINLFRILGYKKNIIRWPLILEGTFLSLAGFIFAMTAMYSVYLQINESYGDRLNLQFFSFFEFIMHLVLSVSIVFFLTVLLTQKIMSDDLIED